MILLIKISIIFNNLLKEISLDNRSRVSLLILKSQRVVGIER